MSFPNRGEGCGVPRLRKIPTFSLFLQTSLKTAETVETVAIETVETVERVEINRKETLKAKCRIGLDGWLRLTAMTPRASLQSYATYSVETEQKKF